MTMGHLADPRGMTWTRLALRCAQRQAAHGLEPVTRSEPGTGREGESTPSEPGGEKGAAFRSSLPVNNTVY